jgi:hypothetical protein
MEDTTTKRPKTTKIAGRSLVPDLAKNRKVIETRYWYWLGALPDLPAGQATAGGISFHKITERVWRDAAGNTQREPRFGATQLLNSDDIKRIRDRLPYLVARISNPDAEIPDRRGKLVRIPTEAEIEERIKNKRPVRRYIQEGGDRPLAEYLFAKLCEDQATHKPGHMYPPPLSESGLEWPDELQD